MDKIHYVLNSDRIAYLIFIFSSIFILNLLTIIYKNDDIMFDDPNYLGNSGSSKYKIPEYWVNNSIFICSISGIYLLYLLFIYLLFDKEDIIKKYIYKFIVYGYLPFVLMLTFSIYLIWFGSNFLEVVKLPDITNNIEEETKESWFNCAIASIVFGSVFTLLSFIELFL